MGTYGPGEIAELCEWIRSRDRRSSRRSARCTSSASDQKTSVLEAKAEILANAASPSWRSTTRVSPRSPTAWSKAGREVVRCSLDGRDADVWSSGDGVRTETLSGSRCTDRGRRRDSTGQLASRTSRALSALSSLSASRSKRQSRPTGGPPEHVASARSRPRVPAVRSCSTTPTTPTRRALAVALSVLAELGADATAGSWSPRGWSSSGRLQQSENAGSRRSAASVATDLVVVGRTNRVRSAGEGARREPEKFGTLRRGGRHPRGGGHLGAGQRGSRRCRALRERPA